jgi:hypothetical protein
MPLNLKMIDSKTGSISTKEDQKMDREDHKIEID